MLLADDRGWRIPQLLYPFCWCNVGRAERAPKMDNGQITRNLGFTEMMSFRKNEKSFKH